MIEFIMPSLGSDMEAGTLVEWRIKPGDKVKRGDIIAEVDTQKGLIEIEVFNEGKIQKLLIREGEKVPVGTLMALIDDEKTSEKKLPEIQATAGHPKITPLARKIAEEHNLDISGLQGTGPEGAITKEDVEKKILSGIPPAEKPLKTMATHETLRSAVAAAMSKAKKEIPHYYLEKKTDLSETMNFVRNYNSLRGPEKRILPVAFLIKAVALSLMEVPELNAIWDKKLILKSDINVGFVISLRSGGIVIPSILNANEKTPEQIMDVLNDLIPRARALNLRSSELTDSTISITSLGDGGADKVFGIIYPPQVALIGCGSISTEPVADNGSIKLKEVVHVTLSGDHRASDGLTGSRFLSLISRYLQKPELL